MLNDIRERHSPDGAKLAEPVVEMISNSRVWGADGKVIRDDVIYNLGSGTEVDSGYILNETVSK